MPSDKKKDHTNSYRPKVYTASFIGNVLAMVGTFLIMILILQDLA